MHGSALGGAAGGRPARAPPLSSGDGPMATAGTANRLSQALRISNMVRKMKVQRRHQDPSTAGLLDAEIDRAIQRARDALNRDPRANGVRRWLKSLVAEKDSRARRRGGW